MTVKELIQFLLEVDDQIMHPRPTSWLAAAQLVRELAEHAEPSIGRGAGADIFGDGWERVNVADDRKRDDKTGW